MSIEKKINIMADLVGGGDDLAGMWNAFIKEDEEMKKLAERIGTDFADKFLHIRDNVVEQIGEVCGGDYKQFLTDILQDYENTGYPHWCVEDDWVIYEGSGIWHSEECADGMIGYILGSEALDDAEITSEEIADRFIKYIKVNSMTF